MARLSLLISCLLLAHVAFALKATELPRKQLAGPPSEFAEHALPTPLSGALVEQSAYFEMFLEAKETEDEEYKLEWKTDILVDSAEEWKLSVVSPLHQKLKLKLKDPNGNKVHLHRGISGNFPIGGQSVPEKTYLFEKPITGTWKLKVTAKAESKEELEKLAASSQGAIIVWNKSTTRAHTHLNTYSLFAGSQVGLVTGITTDETIVPGVRPNILTGVIDDAELEIYFPNGKEVDVQMHDDGLHYDLEANDGVYGATIDATATGVYRATAYISGNNADGSAFIRTSQHLISVVSDNIELSNTATGSLVDSDRLNIVIPVTADQTAQDVLFRAYAEVYGTDSSGNQVPVAWIGGMVSVDTSSTISLELNLNWLSVAGASYPITLQNVVLQETSSFIPVSQQAEISVSTSSFVNKHLDLAKARTVTEITKEMKQGKRTRVSKATNATDAGGAIVLLHGYCSSDNPWQANAQLWTNPAFFLNPNANVNNEQFATLVYEFAEKYGAYSIVGHSQGGMVGLHLLNYFQSGLDDVSNGYLVQSVGTPYQGCTAAGSAANLGSVIGVGCGANADLSVDGATLWLSGITNEAKKQVAYYTTTYELGKFFGDYCNMAMNALLEWPNDGTTELKYASLTGATNKGNTEKQCHTTDMEYVAQYYDVDRIKQMNAQAAR